MQQETHETNAKIRKFKQGYELVLDRVSKLLPSFKATCEYAREHYLSDVHKKVVSYRYGGDFCTNEKQITEGLFAFAITMAYNYWKSHKDECYLDDVIQDSLFSLYQSVPAFLKSDEFDSCFNEDDVPNFDKVEAELYGFVAKKIIIAVMPENYYMQFASNEDEYDARVERMNDQVKKIQAYIKGLPMNRGIAPCIVIDMRYGIGYDRRYDSAEIAKLFNLTKDDVDHILEETVNSVRQNRKLIGIIFE